LNAAKQGKQKEKREFHFVFFIAAALKAFRKDIHPNTNAIQLRFIFFKALLFSKKQKKSFWKFPLKWVRLES
jgi:hypothetical protein